MLATSKPGADFSRECAYPEEAAEKLTKAMADRDSGFVFDAGKLTVGEYLSGWLNHSVRDTARISTYARHEELFRLHIEPALGRVKLKSVTPAHVQNLYRDRLDSGLSPVTVQKIHVVLHKAFDQAVKWSLVPRNVTEAVRASRLTEFSVNFETLCPSVLRQGNR